MEFAQQGRISEPLLDPELVQVERTIAETATLGDAILGALYNQRQRLVGAVEHRKQLNAELEESGNLMQRMMRRITFKHARWYGIIGLLVVAIVVTSWWKMTHPYLEHGRDGEG